MVDCSDDQLDRYLAGELSPAEERQLAQAALDDPELFETLTVAAVAKAAILQDAEAESLQPIGVPAAAIPRPDVQPAYQRARLRSFKPGGLALAGTLAPAAAVIALVMVYRSSWNTVPPSTASVPPGSNPSIGAAVPADSATVTTPPVILTAGIDELAGTARTEFRSLGADGRSPRDTGVVVSVDDGQVAVDLGSIDGLQKGSVVQVFRGRERQAVARLSMTTIFRERSRGDAMSGAVQAGDRVELSPAIRTDALLEQVDARINTGDRQSALGYAERAVAISAAPGVPSNSRRKALDRLGTLQHRAGALDDAARHLRLAVDDFDAAPAAAAVERVRILNELGAVLIERGQYAEAERMLRLAGPHATGADGARVSNNLGALAALRGDRAAAGSMYRSALVLAGDSPDLESDRRAIQKNLAALTPGRGQ